MCLNTAIDISKILDIVIGDDYNANIDLGYENNLYIKITDWDNENEPAAQVLLLMSNSLILMK